MGTHTMNLAPADIPKRSPAYDLPIAVGMLASAQLIPLDALEGAIFTGELALDGALRHVTGILPMAGFARCQGYKRLFVLEVDAAEAALITGIDVITIDHRTHLVVIPLSAGDNSGIVIKR